ncbi:MAG: excinuclease ABC subunit C [Ignavibacteriae bacterium]|nr:excinuclease ABC subunit C [Ignavibacteriota bacterium]
MTEEQSNITINVTGEEVALAEKLDNLPNKPGVYQFKDAEGKVLYVGKAIILRNRVRQYFHKSRRNEPRIDAMVSKIRDVELFVTDSEVEALVLEATLIKKLKPRYNVDLKDDKSYPFIVVTNEPFPRVFVTRRVFKDGSKYFGPYTDVKNMRASLKMIREIFKVRSCNFLINEETIKKRKIKVCLDYHIKKCDGPCEGIITQEKYNEMIHEVVQVIKGKSLSLVHSLQEQMQKAAEELRFEEAAELRDRIKQLSVYSERQKIIDADLDDRDLFNVAIEGNDACGIVFKVREGKLSGKHHVYMSGVEHKADAEIIEQFVQRYYLDAEDIPSEVLLPVDIESHEPMTQWLSQKIEKKVHLIIPKIGEKVRLLNLCKRNAELLLGEWKAQKMKRDDFIPHSVIALQRDLRLKKPPRKIECFDISNIQGSDSVASMVVFVDGKPRKSEYRKFNIQSVQGPDDFASMREVVERRYSRLIEEQGELPDLIMVDGGKGQLSSAVAVLVKLGLRFEESASQEDERESVRNGEGGKNHSHPISHIPHLSKVAHLPIIGLAKRLEEVFIPESDEPQNIPRTSSGLKLLQQIRDEAHRFAITYHRTLRAKRTLQTELDLIEGIGKKRSTELLETFGSVQGVKFATQEQLAEIVGEKVAGKIIEYFAEDAV